MSLCSVYLRDHTVEVFMSRSVQEQESNIYYTTNGEEPDRVFNPLYRSYSDQSGTDCIAGGGC